MGAGIGRLLLAKQGFELVGAYGRRVHRAGTDLGRAIGLERDLGIPISADLKRVVEQTRPDVAIQATCSKIIGARPEVTTLVRNGIHVISIAEEMAYPACTSPSFAREIHELALSSGVGVLGTGINPGFVLDLLIIALTGVCADVRSITATRVNDLSPYGPTVLAAQGVGLEVEAFQNGLQNGTVVGHFGFKESIHMIADVVGWEIEHIQETLEPIVSQVRRETPFVTVKSGQVAGCFHQAVAYHHGAPAITLIHPQQIHPQLEGMATGDTIEIKGTPDLRLAGSPEIPGGMATCNLAVNMIPRLLNAPPGLHCMADLPVPAALLNDAPNFSHRRFQEGRHE
jgi:4-hydroxy-tetrahydrodipicolinate reductase